jgi:hypothetical protein
LPDGAKIVGTVTRDGYDTGAYIELTNGQRVQYNAGVIRRLPGDIGRPRMSSEETVTISLRLPKSMADAIPEPRSDYIRKAIALCLSNPDLKGAEK